MNYLLNQVESFWNVKLPTLKKQRTWKLFKTTYMWKFCLIRRCQKRSFCCCAAINAKYPFHLISQNLIAIPGLRLNIRWGCFFVICADIPTVSRGSHLGFDSGSILGGTGLKKWNRKWTIWHVSNRFLVRAMMIVIMIKRSSAQKQQSGKNPNYSNVHNGWISRERRSVTRFICCHTWIPIEN